VLAELRHALRARIVHGLWLILLPGFVRTFYFSAWRLRRHLDDSFSLGGATKPRELVPLLKAAGDSDLAVELGTGTGWTTIALALARPTRRVITIDLVHHPQRDRYASLVDQTVRHRIQWLERDGEQGPADIEEVGFLFIDAAHDEASTLRQFEAWRPHLAPNAVVAFHDFNDPSWPGVTQAIRRLGLRGLARDHLFVWRADG